MPINKKHDIKIEVLTPLSVGVGAERDYVQGADYVAKDGKVYLLNLRKIVEQGIDVNKLTTHIENHDDKGIVQLIAGKLPQVSDREFTATTLSTNPIKAMTRNALSGRPLVPGSSVKGSLRSHIYKCLEGKGKTDKEVFGDMTNGENLMRFIKLSDFEFDKTELVNTKIFNLQKADGAEWAGGWKHGASQTTSSFRPSGFNTIYEALMPASTAYGSIMLSETMFDTTFKGYGDLKKRDLLSLPRLFAMINENTRQYLLKERNFFDTYSQAEGTDDIIDGIDRLLRLIPTDGRSCILKMSAGVGFHAITGDWQFDDYTGEGNELNRKRPNNPNADKAKPKSRKIAVWGDKKSLMGFVKLSIAEAAEVEAHREAWQEDVASVISSAAALAAEKDRVRREAEELRKQKEDYAKLIKNAQQQMEAGNYADAEALLIQANGLFAEGEHCQLLDDVRLAIRQQNEAKAEQMKAEADVAFDSKNYKDALDIYEQIAQMQVAMPVAERIAACKQRLEGASESIDQFADRLHIASLAAFAGNCKKRVEAGNAFVLGDVAVLAAKIKSAGIPKKELRKWTDLNEWHKAKLFEYLGEDVANALFKEITG